jgi:uncharacterized protein YndB with AHSA1/START domain
MEPITVETFVAAPIEKVWNSWTEPEHITHWNFASDDWQCPTAANDLRVGGKFSSRMEAKDGSGGFDFGGNYIAVEPHKHIAYVMDDGRKVEITFEEQDNGVRVTEIFDPESENPLEMQRGGWQTILDNFKKYVEQT